MFHNPQNDCPPDVYMRARQLLGRVVHEETVDPFTSVIEWNDAEDRTVDDVLGAFDEAIERSTT